MSPGKRPAWVKWVVLGCGGLVVVVACVVVGILALVRGAVAQSDCYKDALAAVRATPPAVAALGEPIEAGVFLSGSVNVNGPSGEAQLSIPVHGPRGKGTIYLEGTKRAGRWTYSLLELELAGGAERTERIDLRAKE